MILTRKLIAGCAACAFLTSALALSMGTSFPANGEDNPYEVAKIPPGLRGDASAVIRDRLISFDVTDRQNASKTVKMAVTIFTPEGRHFGILELGYDRFRRIKDLDGALLDERGEEIRTLGGDDVKDESDIAGYELYADSREKTVHLYHDTYPYTVVFSYRIVYDGYLSWPTWYAQESGEPVEHSRFEVIVPDNQQLRYWLSADSMKPVISVSERGRKACVWEARNLPQLSEDQLNEDIELRTTVVRTAPVEFKIDDYPGEMRTWREFGRWMATLYAGKNNLAPSAAKDVISVTASAHTDREKIDTLYRYLQSRTRYVAVTLGIGGWQPFDASFVHEKGYGDCKALSNYMVALLKGAGITAYPALVDAGGSRSLVREEFPSNEFNHVIVCVPGRKDSVWLECTSQSQPPGHLGTFTENRPALLITPDGGVLVHTPSSTEEQNRLSWSGRVVITSEGTASANLLALRSGDQSDQARESLLHNSPQKQDDWLLSEVEVVGSVLRDHAVAGLRSSSGVISITEQLDMPNFASRSGSRLFFQPNITDRNFRPPRDVSGRKSPARLSYPYVDSDSLLYVFPSGYGKEALPSPVTLATSFGKFRSAATALGDTALLYTRTLEMRERLIPAERYNELAGFLRAVARADKAQIVLTRRD